MNRRKKNRKNKTTLEDPIFEPFSDADFAYIAGYTAGGAPYGITWEEWDSDVQTECASFTAEKTARPFHKWAPDLDEWPESWMGVKEDLEYGMKLLPYFTEFLQDLYDKGLSKKTFGQYRDCLWLLGSSIISRVSTYKEHHVDPLDKLYKSVTGDGILPDHHDQMSTVEMNEFCRMCRRFENHLDRTYESRF